MKKVSLIIPCFNEEEAINFLYKSVKEIANSLLDYDFEYIFVDDGSKDKTLLLIKKLFESDKRINYISFSRNFGKEVAMYAGFCNATLNIDGLISFKVSKQTTKVSIEYTKSTNLKIANIISLISFILIIIFYMINKINYYIKNRDK